MDEANSSSVSSSSSSNLGVTKSAMEGRMKGRQNTKKVE